MLVATVQHIPPIYVYFEAENIPPTGFSFLDNAAAGTRTVAVDKMKRVNLFVFVYDIFFLNLTI